ncbi:uncharacterized protein LOC122724375 [Manihot esculenta]|uniref:uncharacterized protein LOC122724375 n=1 Tax=Manihot esculenta TaxID=3983 RepID=UPI001CC33414|nr:uncharacterized protein LOC122724375 [Manihot esculenta]
MWQLLLAAALAGSATFVAKHFLAQERPKEEENPFEDSIASAFQSPLFPNHGNGYGYDSNFQQPPDGIFRFSSSASASSPSGKKTRISRKKSGITGRRLNFGAENYKADKRSGGSEKHFLAQECPKEEENPFEDSIASAFQSPLFPNHGSGCGYDSNFQQPPDWIFRFSSSASASSPSGKKTRISRKKSGITGRRLNFGAENYKADKRSGGSEKSARRRLNFGAEDDKRSGGSEKSARRFAVCLKKRRTAKSVPSKCGSRSSKDSSLFGCGLGIGIMYMMSAEKAEISKLSNAMDEIAKTVKELRTELYKRRSAKVAAISKDLSSNNELEFYRAGTGHNNDPKVIKVSGIPMIDDVECPSSGLIEEPEPQLLEMDQLEAELASELQKLPWSYPEASGHEGVEPNMDKNETFSGGLHKLEGQSNISFQCHGVLPSELDQKLSYLLIEQLENQIEELESELHSVQSKLHEKEAELDCVKLTRD